MRAKRSVSGAREAANIGLHTLRVGGAIRMFENSPGNLHILLLGVIIGSGAQV
jgi:hypothetical protein